MCDCAFRSDAATAVTAYAPCRAAYFVFVTDYRVADAYNTTVRTDA